MKYFVAVVPDEKTSSQIFTFQKSFPNNDVVNVVEPHVTIKRPGTVSDVDSWVEKIKNITKDTKLFQLSLERVNSFGDSVVFLEPNNSKELFALHRKIFNISEPNDEDVIYENENYIPHLTLAGTKWKITKDELLDLKEKAQRVFVAEMDFPVTFLRIYRKDTGAKKWEIYLDVEFGT